MERDLYFYAHSFKEGISVLFQFIMMISNFNFMVRKLRFSLYHKVLRK